MTRNSIKPDAHRIVDELPDGSTSDDFIEAIATRIALDDGINDVEAGQTIRREDAVRRGEVVDADAAANPAAI